MPLRRTIVVAAALVAACDSSPTAPRVREAVEQAQQRIFATPDAWSAFRPLFNRALSNPGTFPTAPIAVLQDGDWTMYSAIVMERVYLPPASSHAVPYVRRMLIGWDTVAQRGIALASDDSVSTVIAPSAASVGADGSRFNWNNVGFISTVDDRSSDTWVGREGSLVFQSGAHIEACAFKDVGATYGFAYAERPNDKESCDKMNYVVTASAYLERHDRDGERSFMDRLTNRRASFRIDAQDVPGIRIVTPCPNDFPTSGPLIMGCTTVRNFWRSQSAFSRDLGLDLSRLENTGNANVFAQVLQPGVGPAIDCCTHYNAEVRYTIFTPAGEIVRHADAARFSSDTGLTRLEVGPMMRGELHALFLAPARQFVRAARDYDMYVVDLTVLPCRPGFRRNDVAFFGNAYPDGGCYPEANFRR